MPLKIAFVIEWENAKLSDLARANAMLLAVSRQVTALAAAQDLRADLLVLFDDAEIARAIPEGAVAGHVDAVTWPGEIGLIAVPGLGYYDQKNHGADLADADWIVFLDSDVIPEDGWLSGLVRAMRMPEVRVVSGETFLTHDSLYERLFAAFWLFDDRKPDQGLRAGKGFYANNAAFRADVICAHPFPKADCYRGQCAALARELRAAGEPIYRQGASAVSHPPPDGVSHLVVRAVCHGYDTVYWRHRKGRLALRNTPVSSVLGFFGYVGTSAANVARRRRGLGLGPLEALLAIALGIFYYAVKLFGEIAAYVAPGFVRRRFSV